MIASSLINYFIVSSLCLLAFYLFYATFLKRQQHFNIHRAYLLITSALSLIIPMVEIQISSQTMNMPVLQWEGYILLPAVEAETTIKSEIALPSWQNILLLAYFIGCTISLMIMCSRLYQVLSFIWKNRTKIIIKKGYYLIPTHGQLATSSFFKFLFWNNQATTSQEEKKQILAHEQVHITEKHSYDIIYFSLLKACFWFHPAVYWYSQEITQLHEFIADARVVSKHSLKSYQHILAKQAVFSNLSLANHFYKSHILKRIKMMERNPQKSFPYRIFITIPLLATVFYVFSCKEEDEMAKLDALSEQYKNAKTDEEKAALADADEVFMVVEDQPTPEGGMKAFYDYIRNNLEYPAEARSAGIEGKVFVQFVVETDGSLKDVKVLKGIGGGCDEEALKVVMKSPAWNPGLQRGQAVKVRIVLPITFSLENGGSPSANTDKLQQLEDEMQVQFSSKSGNMIKGNVTSSEGKQLAGVNIVIKGSTTGTVSDVNGQFSITIPPGTDAKELVFSSVGFETKSVTL